MKDELNEYKKTKNGVMIDESFEMRNYMKELTVSEARTMFKHRCHMTQCVKMNFKNDKQFARTLWKCNHCQKMDSESHLLWCDAYKELRQNKNLSNDKDLCKYLQDILRLRIKEETDDDIIK